MTGTTKIGKDCDSLSIGFEQRIGSILDNPAGLLGKLDFRRIPQKEINVDLPISVQVYFDSI